jgi:F0F1-type ATP synthase assembly protein I
MGERGQRGSGRGLGPLAAYGIYGAAGLQLAASVVGFLLLGNWLDGKLGLTPWLAVAGLIVGFVGGLVNLIRIVRRFGIVSDDEEDR